MSEVRSIQGLRLLALALAIITWYFVRLSDGGATTNVVSFANEYTIQYAVPNSLVVLSSTETVQLTIQGRESIVEKFNPFLVRVKVDISEDQFGVHQFLLTNDNVTLPEGLAVTAFEPSVVTVELDAFTTQMKGVIAVPAGEPAAGAIVQELTPSPSLVTVSGPKSELEKYESVMTAPIDLTGHAIDFQERTTIVLPSQSLALVEPSSRSVAVSVKLTIPGNEDDLLDGDLENPDDPEGASGTGTAPRPNNGQDNNPAGGGNAAAPPSGRG